MRFMHALGRGEKGKTLPLVPLGRMELTVEMMRTATQAILPSRRFVLGAIGALSATTALGGRLWAQEAPAPSVTKISFDLLSEEMKALATQPDQKLPQPESFLNELTYDDYQKIKFRDERAPWTAEDSAFRVFPFHMGWLFADPVKIYEVNGDDATPMQISTDDFEYIGDLAARVPQHFELPGVAGFRLNAPLNRADLFVSIGTSGAVYPAAGLVREARQNGIATLELNLEPSHGSSWFSESRHGPATELVPKWVDELLSG